MKSLLPFIALSVAWYTPAAGQIKPLVQKGRITTTLTFDGPRSFALPTACDDQGRSYVKLWTGNGSKGPVFRVSDKGVIEAQFDSPEMLGNTFAVRPDAGIAVPHLEDRGKTKVIDNFGPDGARESQVRLETPLIPFFPEQIAVFPSGGFFLAGGHDQANKPSASVYDAEGHLLKQLDLGGDELSHQGSSGEDGGPLLAKDSTSRSICWFS